MPYVKIVILNIDIILDKTADTFSSEMLIKIEWVKDFNFQKKYIQSICVCSVHHSVEKKFTGVLGGDLCLSLNHLAT